MPAAWKQLLYKERLLLAICQNGTCEATYLLLANNNSIHTPTAITYSLALFPGSTTQARGKAVEPGNEATYFPQSRALCVLHTEITFITNTKRLKNSVPIPHPA